MRLSWWRSLSESVAEASRAGGKVVRGRLENECLSKHGKKFEGHVWV